MKTSLSSNPTHPLDTVAPYSTMFRPEFPLAALDGATGWMLDPFCGRGTTNFAARLLGLPSVGIDLSPVAVASARAKLVSAEPDAIVELTRALIQRGCGEADCPSGSFWDLAYHPQTLLEICAIRRGLLERTNEDDQTAIALRAIMLGALH